MYNRRNDSRMGDEIFAMALLFAPLAWKLVKKGEAMVVSKKKKFDALPIEEQNRKKFKLFSIGMIAFEGLICIRVVLAIISLFNGSFTMGDITSLLVYFGICFAMKLGKKKYEIYSTTYSQ